MKEKQQMSTSSPKYSELAETLLKQRYLKEGESPEDMFNRVARWVSQNEEARQDYWQARFFDIMNDLDFLPNSPCLMNAATSMPQLAACFVYPIEDDMESIFDTLKHTALTHKSGGGTGFSFSRLRPSGDRVGLTGGVTSGPVSFMEVYDKATEAIRQGGKRRGANMGILRVDHPDIEDFIDAKTAEDKLNNFNISVALTDEFMRAVRSGSTYKLYFPSHGQIRGEKDARTVFDKIVRGAWKNGDPGVLFIDRINRKNPLISMGEIEATNPCGEQPLLPYEACILGSVNLKTHISSDGSIDWEKLRRTVDTAVRFLDDAIDVSDYPLKEIHDIVRRNRKIGLGIMGFASMLMEMETPYSSVKAAKLGRGIMRFINDAAHKASEKLAEEKGEFPNFYRSNLSVKRRNALCTTIAPTGTISIIAGVSSGIEPLYSLVTERRTEEGKLYRLIDPVFEKSIEKYGLDRGRTIEAVVENGGIKEIVWIQEDIRRCFLSALEIDPRMHVIMQAAFQKYVDNAISKTVNLPEDFTVSDVKDIIWKAYHTGCKGITVFRQYSRKQQVLNIVCACEDDVRSDEQSSRRENG